MLFPVLILYIVVSYVYPGQIFPALAPYRITYWTGLTGLGLCVFWVALKRSSALSTLQLWFLACFTVMLALSRIVNEGYLGAVVPTLKAFGPSLAMFILTVCAVDSIRRLRIVAGLVGALSLFLVLQGAAAYHFGYHTEMFLFDPVTRAEYVANANADDSGEAIESNATEGADAEEDGEVSLADTQLRIRGLGLLNDPNDLALGLVLAVPLLTAFWRRNGGFRNFVLVTLPIAILVYGVYLTHSRGGTVALLLTLAYAMSRRIGRVPAVIAACVLAAVVVAANFAGGRQLTGGDESAQGRVQAWSEGLQMLKAQPVLGVGYGQFLDHHTLTAHNSFVLCFAETGLVGYFFWLGLLVASYLYMRAMRAVPQKEPIDAEIARWSGILQLSLFGFLIAAFFLSRTFVPMLYLLLGLVVALVLIARDAGHTIALPPMPQFGTLLVVSEVLSIASIYLFIKLHIA